MPNYSIIHKQDIFITEKYRPDIGKDGPGFLSRSFERHFNERPYLNHTCYLFLTKTTRERSRQQSNWNTLCRKFLVPKEIQDRETMERFMESVGQFESIVNDSGLARLERLSTEEITGTEDGPGIIERYLTLSSDGSVMLQDMQLNPDGMRIGDKRLCLHTLSDLDNLPGRVRTDGRYERLSTDRSDCRLSYASPVGIMLPCDHIYNQWIFIDDSSENLARFEKTAKNMQSLSRYSRSNQINKEWLDEYLNVAHTNGLQSVRCHCNVIAWAESGDELRRVKNDVGSALALMECTPRHNTTDLPVLYWAGIPGNEADFPSEESFYTFTEQALCFFTAETCYRNSLSPFGLRMVDRLTGKPVFLDISDLPMKKGVVTNRNKFILGPSGSGKSFFTNHMVRQYWEQGTHILLVDTGNSYKGLCDLIRQKTNGDDGVYFTYQENDPISFNPFFTEDYRYDIEKRDSIKTLILTLWKRDYPVYQAHLKGAAALIAVQSRGYAQIDDTALNAQDIAGPSCAPAFSMSRADFLMIHQLMEEKNENGNRVPELSVEFDADTEVIKDQYTYNIVGKIPGTDSDSMILLSAHYDSYFEGFQDDNAACLTFITPHPAPSSVV